MSTNVAVLGRGRMGQEIQNCISESDDLRLAGVWVRNSGADHDDTPSSENGSLATVLSSAHVAVDFTLPGATSQVLAAALEAKTPLVCGVSGLSDANLKDMAVVAKKIPILYDRNMSVGVAVLQRLVQQSGASLGNQFEAEIHETHHVKKLDAPSGTALQLGEALAASRDQDFAAVFHYDEDDGSKPAKGEIHFEVTRRGDVPGEHTVMFRSDDESLALTHSVTNRRVFAVGALRAARWLLTQSPGLYSMQDLLKLNTLG